MEFGLKMIKLFLVFSLMVTEGKQEVTLDRIRNEHIIRMPWHGSDPYLDGIVG